MPKFSTIDAGVRPFISAHPEFEFFVGLERQNGSRTFFLYPDAQQFISDMLMNLLACWHEYVFPDRRVKLYFDVDDKRTREGWDELIENIVQCVTNVVGERPRHVEWMGHTPDKLSAHLIFPTVGFPNAAALCAFVKKVHVQLGRDDRIDTQVYTESPTVFKSLRAPYCAKYGRTNALTPKGGPQEFDAAWFLESLVTNIREGAPMTMLNFESPERALSPREDVDEDTDPVRLRALQHIRDVFVQYLCVDKIEVKQKLDARTGRWLWRVTPGMWCPIKKTRHRSNAMMVRGSLYFNRLAKIESYCLDEKCKQWIETKNMKYWSKVAFPSGGVKDPVHAEDWLQDMGNGQFLM